MPENVAFKCTYNDGGDRGFVGFGGTCSNGNIIRNVKAGRIWCSHADNPCRKFYEGDFQGIRPDLPCLESKIFTRWKFGPGTYRSGVREGHPIPMIGPGEGKVALLTTRHPDYDNEHQRIVFGVFKIVKYKNKATGVRVKGKSDNAIRLPEAAALSLPYWRFKAYPPHGPRWDSGLFRYISDQEVSNFLHALRPFLQNAPDRMTLERLLQCCGGLPRKTAEENVDVEIPGAESRTKYGPGGEGKEHRLLKKYIAANPHKLELGPGKGRVEHGFVTGDRVDVVVNLENGERCVVEIEVKGPSTMTGAHQALKYRALLAGQLDNATKPHAFLVAYSIPNYVKRFCERHGVTALEIQPD